MRPMKYKFLLPVMALMLSCNFITGLGSGSSAEGGIDLDSPADPVNVTVELNEDETTSAVIPPEGGELTLTSADGSVYTLDVPAGALLTETEISMTTIGSLEGGPVESNVYGVQLEPSGLAFDELLTLTIKPAVDIPLEEQIVFKYEGNGEDFHNAVIDPDSSEIKISLLDFSGGGVGKSFRDYSYTWELGKAKATSARLENQLGKTLQEARKGKLSKTQKEARIDKILNQYFKDVVQKEMNAAREDCKHLGKALESKKKYEQWRDKYASDNYLHPIADDTNFQYRCYKFSASGEFAGTPIKSDAILINQSFALEGSDGTCTSVMTFYPTSSDRPFSGTTSVESSCGKFTASGNGHYTITLTENGGVLKGNSNWLAAGVPGDESEDWPISATLIRLAP
jgi:hypothetical protein